MEFPLGIITVLCVVSRKVYKNDVLIFFVEPYLGRLIRVLIQYNDISLPFIINTFYMTKNRDIIQYIQVYKITNFRSVLGLSVLGLRH